MEKKIFRQSHNQSNILKSAVITTADRKYIAIRNRLLKLFQFKTNNKLKQTYGKFLYKNLELNSMDDFSRRLNRKKAKSSCDLREFVKITKIIEGNKIQQIKILKRKCNSEMKVKCKINTSQYLSNYAKKKSQLEKLLLPPIDIRSSFLHEKITTKLVQSTQNKQIKLLNNNLEEHNDLPKFTKDNIFVTLKNLNDILIKKKIMIKKGNPERTIHIKIPSTESKNVEYTDLLFP